MQIYVQKIVMEEQVTISILKYFIFSLFAALEIASNARNGSKAVEILLGHSTPH